MPIKITLMKNHQSLQGYQDENGKFHSFPGKRQKEKQALMLQYLASKFKAGKKYSEQEVNDILNDHHNFNDPATLRRLMFGKRLINRTVDGRQYWLNP